jgi:hypothetical protein
MFVEEFIIRVYLLVDNFFKNVVKQSLRSRGKTLITIEIVG